MEVIDHTRLLGTVISDDLKWNLNTETIVKEVEEGGRIWGTSRGFKNCLHFVYQKSARTVCHSLA